MPQDPKADMRPLRQPDVATANISLPTAMPTPNKPTVHALRFKHSPEDSTPQPDVEVANVGPATVLPILIEPTAHASRAKCSQ